MMMRMMMIGDDDDDDVMLLCDQKWTQTIPELNLNTRARVLIV